MARKQTIGITICSTSRNTALLILVSAAFAAAFASKSPKDPDRAFKWTLPPPPPPGHYRGCRCPATVARSCNMCVGVGVVVGLAWKECSWGWEAGGRPGGRTGGCLALVLCLCGACERNERPTAQFLTNTLALLLLPLVVCAYKSAQASFWLPLECFS